MSLSMPGAFVSIVKKTERVLPKAGGQVEVRAYWGVHMVESVWLWSGDVSDQNAYLEDLAYVSTPDDAAKVIWSALQEDQRLAVYDFLRIRRECTEDEVVKCMRIHADPIKGTRVILDANDGGDPIVFHARQRTPGNRVISGLKGLVDKDAAARLVFPQLSGDERARLAKQFGA